MILAAGGCSTKVSGAQAFQPPPWPTTTGHIGVAPIPTFPATLPHWAKHAAWSDLPRAFESQWTNVAGPHQERFPATMNGCDDQRFLLRWRTINQAVTVDAQPVGANGAQSGTQVTGAAGWMDFDGCQTPQFRFHGTPPTGATNLTDVTVSVEQWLPAP
jgi:hypothetical protein